VRQLVLFRKTGGGYGVEAAEKALVGGLLAPERRRRNVVELIVVAVVADRGGAFRMRLEISLVLLFEQRVLRRNARGERIRILGGGAQRAGNQQGNESGFVHILKL
jgi:hypothetical protein